MQKRRFLIQFGDWYTGSWWVECYIWYSEEGAGQAAAPPSPLFAVPKSHPSTASVPTSYCSMWHLHSDGNYCSAEWLFENSMNKWSSKPHCRLLPPGEFNDMILSHTVAMVTTNVVKTETNTTEAKQYLIVCRWWTLLYLFISSHTADLVGALLVAYSCQYHA